MIQIPSVLDRPRFLACLDAMSDEEIKPIAAAHPGLRRCLVPVGAEVVPMATAPTPGPTKTREPKASAPIDKTALLSALTVKPSSIPTPEQIEILRQALAVVNGAPTRDHYASATRGDGPECEAMVAGGLMVRCCETLGGARFYKVTGAGVRAACPGSRAATYAGDDVTVFTSKSGKFRMRWDGTDKGRFQQGAVYRVNAQAFKFKEAE